MKLVVGLGNPGLEHRGTRHNVGFDVVDLLSSRHGSGGRLARSKFQGLLEEVPVRGERVLLLKPLTYMNRSGLSTAEAIRFHKLDPAADLMVVVDDMAIPCGTIRLRGEGGAGGHQGLVDVERALGGARYPRCRVGIDGPGEQSWSDYVLGRHRPEQRPLVDAGIALAADAVEVWASEGLPAAMNRFNRPDRPESAGTPRPTRPDRPATPPDASSPGSAGRSPS
ncbi:MAG: aminoacyl-tRNA hydrolase [Phycisphaerae bacterium]|nr:aminoacyl-tRNA hydrolase [Phycisphaerae bacterium]